MVVVYSIGAILMLCGGILGFYRLSKIITCKGVIKGKVFSIENSDTADSCRIVYKYSVNEKEYMGKSRWQSYGEFNVGDTCKIAYNFNKPKKSYMKSLAYYLGCGFGLFFFLLGLFIILCGIYVLPVLF